MKNRTLLFSFSALPLLAAVIFLASSHSGERSYVPRSSNPARGVAGATEYWKMIRNNQVTGEVDFADLQMVLKQVKDLSMQKGLSWAWEEMGPDNRGGRTRAILFDKTNPQIMYAGAVSGGLWKSTSGGSSWFKVASISETMIISSLAQSSNGDVYVGTGEWFYTHAGAGIGTGVGGFQGMGIFKSTDGTNFAQLPSTNNNTFMYVNELAVNQDNGKVYAATKAGLKVSDDGGSTWNVVLSFFPSSGNVNTSADDVNIGNDGTVVTVLNKHCYVAANGVDFTRVSGNLPTYSLPQAGSRMEVAIAPSDPNYIYAVLAANNGTTQGIYRTTDKGANWVQIAPAATTNFDIHRNQGDYDNAIEVYPNNKNKIIVGGINIWTWQEGGTWTQITSGDFSETSSYYVHVDIHEFAFHPTNPDIVFVGCDAGMHRSIDGGLSWNMMNKNFSTIQYFAIASSGSGQVMGGTQDNSYQFIDFMGNTPKSASTIFGGDGGYAAISQLNNLSYFVSSQYGNAGRTADGGATWQSSRKGTTTNDTAFFNKRMLEEGTPGTNFSSFVTPLRLWETIHAYDAKDSLMFIADTNYIAGEMIVLRGLHHGYPFEHTLLAGLHKGDTMMVQNPIQSMFVIASRTGLWMTREPLDFSGTPKWFRIGVIAGGALQTFNISDDGNHIFVGTSNGNIYRFSNIRQAYDFESADETSPNQVITKTLIANYPGRAVTSIAIDPINSDHVVITLGNYGNTSFVYRSTNATDSTPSFGQKMGAGTTRLPNFPVYASLIPMHNPNVLIVGTEFGAYMTENINVANPTWSEVNVGMDRVPVLMLHQHTIAFPYNSVLVGEGDDQILVEYPATTNYGAIYAGTHGRGAFRNLDFVGIEKPKTPKSGTFKSQLMIYPNPVIDDATIVFNLNKKANVLVNVYDLSGRVVASFNEGRKNSGRNEMKVEMAGLKRGNYIVQVIAGNESKSAKVLKR